MNYKLKTLGTMIVLAGVAMLPLVKADDWDRETKLTVSVPVAVPGKVLAPGTYVFKLADNEANRNVVQIFNEEKTQLITTVLTIPAYRLELTGETVITFKEEPTGNAQAIGRWFFAGEQQGVGFVYPGSE